MTPAKGEPQPDLFGWRASFKGVYLGTFNDADAAADAIRAQLGRDTERYRRAYLAAKRKCGMSPAMYYRQRSLRTNLSVILSNIRVRSRGKREVSITVLDVLDLLDAQAWRCALTGRALVFSAGHGARMDSPSVDRIDSTKGYVKGNIQIVIHAANVAKGTMTVDEFVAMCRDVVQTYDLAHSVSPIYQQTLNAADPLKGKVA